MCLQTLQVISTKILQKQNKNKGSEVKIQNNSLQIGTTIENMIWFLLISPGIYNNMIFLHIKANEAWHFHTLTTP